MNPHHDCLQDDLTPEERQTRAKDFHDYKDDTEPIYNTIGALSIILCAMILTYLAYFAFKKRRLAQFTWVSLIMMSIIEVLSASNLLSF